MFFFFQAEDGIRDLTVTGVQTCALPILTTFSFAKIAIWSQLASTSACARWVGGKLAPQTWRCRRILYLGAVRRWSIRVFRFHVISMKELRTSRCVSR